jgi:hypothetical protein
MVYLIIKELSPSADEVICYALTLFSSLIFFCRCTKYWLLTNYVPCQQQVIIVTSSLMKDMNSKTDMYRANAIRVLCRITDGTLLTQIERYLKQAIVDKNPVVASAALVSGIHLLQVLINCPCSKLFSFLIPSPKFLIYLLMFFRRTQRLSKGGVMRFKKLYSQGLPLYNFMHWLCSSR